MKKFLLMMAIQGVAIIGFSQEEQFIPISMQPEGTIRAYFRSGMSTSRGTSMPFEQNPDMAMMVCFAPDGKTVYLQNPISSAFLDTWVKGELADDGQTLTVPLPQPLWWYDAFGYGIMLGMVDLNITENSYSATYDPEATSVTYTIVDDEIRLNGTGPTKGIGVVYTDDHTCVGMNDYESVCHYQGDEMVAVPAEAQRQHYIVRATNQDKDYEENINAEVAVLGDDVWFKGYTSMLPAAWIHGKREGDKIHLSKNQLIGTYAGYPLFYCSNEGNDVADGTWSYEESTQTYTADGFSFVNAKKNEIYHFTYYRTLEFTPASKHDGAYQLSTDPIVSKQPVGEVRTMMRTGLAYYYNQNGNYIGYTSQGGMPLRMVYADDNVVWMLNPVSYCAEDKWVRGRLSDDGQKITVPLGQQLYYETGEGWGYATAILRYNAQKQSYDIDENIAEVTFTIDGDRITLDGCDQQTIYGIIYTDDYTWAGYGDFDTFYIPAPTEHTTIPEEAEAGLWSISYTDFNGNYGGRLLTGAVVGDKFYLCDFTDKDHDGAIVGTIDGDKVTFQSGQYIGNGAGYYSFFDAGKRIEVYNREDDQWYYDFDYAPSITLAYDAERQTLTADEGTSMLIDAGRGEFAVSYVVVMDQPFISAYTERPAVPEDPAILMFDDTYFRDEGYCSMNMQIRPFDVDGNVIRLDRLYYRLFVKSQGEVEPFFFDADDYQNLDESLEMIPYTFSDDFDFGRGGSFVFLYAPATDDIGVQVVNLSGEEERHSNIVWYIAGVEEGTNSTAIRQLMNDETTLPLYNLQGLRIDQPHPGQIVIQGSARRYYRP